jgi:hypothetical protein
MVEHSAKIVHLRFSSDRRVLDQEQVGKLMQSRYDPTHSRNTLAQDLLARLACSTPFTRKT